MITETEARAVLAQLEEPVTKTDYVTGKMLEKIEVDEEGNVSVAIRLGYPAKSWAQKVGEAVGEALKQAGGRSSGTRCRGRRRPSPTSRTSLP